jgi:hypothetical protein
VAISKGEFTDAAARYAEIGSRPLEAQARLRAAEQLGTEGRLAEATTQLDRCAPFWTSVRASAYLEHVELARRRIMSA